MLRPLRLKMCTLRPLLLKMGMLQFRATEIFARPSATKNRYDANLRDPKKVCCTIATQNGYVATLRNKIFARICLNKNNTLRFCATQKQYVAIPRLDMF